MIKVKKSWRRVEENIIKACQNLPEGVTLRTSNFGIVENSGVIEVCDSHRQVCPLGAALLGKESNFDNEWHDLLGVSEKWFTGFWMGVDNSKTGLLGDDEKDNDHRAGYQAGKRVAKKVGLR